MEDKLLIIDSNALLHRAFHALPPLKTKSGENTSAIYGFLLILFRAIKDLNPKYMVACFDLPQPTFRHEKYKEYKATRLKTPDEIKEQLPKMKEVLKAFDIPVFEKPGFEADDLIATISTEASKDKKIDVYILSGDLDVLQLVSKNIKAYTMGRGIKEMVIYDEEKVSERFGIKPGQMVDFKALIGDSSDNIPGVKGVGKKTASVLLNKFGNLDIIYKEAERDSEEIKPRIRELLLKSKDQAFLARSLVVAKRDVTLDFDIEKSQFGNYDRKKVEEMLRKFEFFTLLNRLPGADPSSRTAVHYGAEQKPEPQKTIQKLL